MRDESDQTERKCKFKISKTDWLFLFYIYMDSYKPIIVILKVVFTGHRAYHICDEIVFRRQSFSEIHLPSEWYSDRRRWEILESFPHTTNWS